MRSAGGGQAEVRVQPRQALRLRAGRDRADRDSRRLSPGLRGHGRQHLGQDDAAGFSGQDRVTPQTFHFALDRKKLRIARRREGGYLLRSNIRGDDPGHLWRLYLQLVEIEQAFKELKNDLSIRPIHHQLEDRIEAHIFVAFLAYGLMVTLKQRLKALAPGLTPRAVLEKLAAIQMIDVELPTTDGRTVVLARHTEPENDHLLLLQRLKLALPAQPPPKITAPPLRPAA